MGSLRFFLAAALVFAAPAAVLAQDAPPAVPAQTERERLAASLKTEVEIAEARNALREASVDAAPPSSIAGSTEAGAGAGQAETLILAAQQLEALSGEIVRKLAGLPAPTLAAAVNPDQRFLITTGTAYPDLAALNAFEIRRRAVEEDLRRATAGVDAVRALTLPPRSGQAAESQYFLSLRRDVNKLFAGDTLSAASLADIGGPLVSALRITSAVSSYFSSNFSATGAEVKGLDDAALVSAVIEAGRGGVGLLQETVVTPAVQTAFFRQLEALDTARDGIEGARRICTQLRADMDQQVAASAEAGRPAIRRAYALKLDTCQPIDTAVTSHAAFATEFGGSTAAAERASAVLRQMSVQEQLRGRILVTLNLHSVEGSAYTQQNVFSNFGLMPFHVTTSTVAGWRAFGADGVLLAGALEPAYAGYERLQGIDRLINGCRSVEDRRRARRNQSRSDCKSDTVPTN